MRGLVVGAGLGAVVTLALSRAEVRAPQSVGLFGWLPVAAVVWLCGDRSWRGALESRAADAGDASSLTCQYRRLDLLG